MNPIWVNSRGAIPRFDRGSIEIRIMDIQECPAADIATLTLVIETIKALAAGEFIGLEAQMKWKTEVLAQLLDLTTIKGHEAVIDNSEYLNIFGFPDTKGTAGELWRHIQDRLLTSGNSPLQKVNAELMVVLKKGTLAHRMVQAIGGDESKENISRVYRQ